MKHGLHVSACRTCGRKVFPPPALCPACGGASWTRVPAGQGVVEEVTTVRHAVGAGGEPSIVLASVRLDAGPVVVVGIDGGAGAGDRVELVVVDCAPVGRLLDDRGKGAALASSRESQTNARPIDPV